MFFGSKARPSGRGKVVTLAAGLCIAAPLVLTACGDSGQGDGDVVTLTLWDTDARTARTERIEHLIEMFEESHEGIQVEYVGLPTDSYMEKIETAIATETTPDLLTPKASDLSALTTQGALAALDERFVADGFDKTMSESMVAAARSAVVDEKLYLTPSTSLTDVIWYRPDLIEDAGLDTPETWSDFFNAAEVLTNREAGEFGYTIRGGAGFWPQFVGMVLPIAGENRYFDEDGKSVFRKPEVVEAAREYAGLYDTTTAKSDLTADFKVMVAQFGTGAAAMLSHSIGSYPDHVDALGVENVEALVAFPSENNGVRVQSSLVLGFAMFENSEHPEESWEFLKFMMSQEANSYWAEESGYIPGNLEVAKESWVTDSQPIKVSQEAMEDEATLPLEHPYYLPEFNAITGTEMLPEWQKVLQGDLTIDAFCEQLADKFEEAKEAFDSRNA